MGIWPSRERLHFPQSLFSRWGLRLNSNVGGSDRYNSYFTNHFHSSCAFVGTAGMIWNHDVETTYCGNWSYRKIEKDEAALSPGLPAGTFTLSQPLSIRASHSSQTRFLTNMPLFIGYIGKNLKLRVLKMIMRTLDIRSYIMGAKNISRMHSFSAVLLSQNKWKEANTHQKVG